MGWRPWLGGAGVVPPGREGGRVHALHTEILSLSLLLMPGPCTAQRDTLSLTPAHGGPIHCQQRYSLSCSCRVHALPTEIRSLSPAHAGLMHCPRAIRKHTTPRPRAPPRGESTSPLSLSPSLSLSALALSLSLPVALAHSSLSLSLSLSLSGGTLQWKRRGRRAAAEEEGAARAPCPRPCPGPPARTCPRSLRTRRRRGHGARRAARWVWVCGVRGVWGGSGGALKVCP